MKTVMETIQAGSPVRCALTSEESIMDAVYTHAIETQKPFLKDPGSAITHGIALLLAVTGAIPLIIKAARSYDVIHIVALSIFILTMILLYAASTIYHSIDSTKKVNRRLR